MSKNPKRRRGTAIVDTPDGILILIEKGGDLALLPGGGAERSESRMQVSKGAKAIITLYQQMRRDRPDFFATLDNPPGIRQYSHADVSY